MSRQITKAVAGQPCWTLVSRNIELAVTCLGGHMAPVMFARDTDTPIAPYYISPWQRERLSIDEPVLVPLRGDFFCLPFGSGGLHKGRRHVVHGQPATARWGHVESSRGQGRSLLRLEMRTSAPAGRIVKTLRLADGHDAIYCEHELWGFSGRWPVGHHATLRLGAKPGWMRISTSPMRMGMTAPSMFSDPAQGQYQSLAVGRRFRRLDSVPLMWARPARGDCSSLPARPGFADLLACVAKRTAQPAWTTASVPDEGYLWFSLKDPLVLPTMVMWIEDRGRHNSPWLGRNRCVGLEDVCAYFAEPAAASVGPNELSRGGVATALRLSAATPTGVRYIQGAVRTPKGFDVVRTVEFSPGEVTFISRAGPRAKARVDWDFVKSSGRR
jgi:hypothetical protein